MSAHHAGARTGPLRVAIFNQYFPPDASATAAVFEDMCRALLDGGHEVTMVCGRPSYDPRPGAGPSLERLRILRVPSTSFDRRRALGRVSNYFTYLIDAVAAGASRRRRIDVAIAGTDPPLAVLAALATGAPTVYSLQDLHPDAAVEAGLLTPSWLTRLWDRVHVRALRRASAVVCLGETMAARVAAKGVDENRIHVVHNGARPRAGSAKPDIVRRLRGNASFVALHAGNLGSVGAWDVLLRARKGLDPECDIVFVGDGIQAEAIRSAGAPLHPFLEEADLASVMAAGDLQVVTVRHGVEGLVVPSKLYTALAYGRPVLVVAPPTSEIAQLTTRYGFGLVADPLDAQDVASKIEWARDHPGDLDEMAKRASQAAVRLGRTAAMERVTEIVETVGARSERVS